MAAKVATVWANLVSAVEAINGTSPYTHDLSGSGRVGREWVDSPAIEPPYALVVFGEARTRHDVEIGAYRRDLIFWVVGWGEVAADTPTARAEAALNMADDLLRAIEKDRTLSGTVYDVLSDLTSFVGAEPQTGDQYAVTVLRVECYLRVDTGI